MKTTTLADSLFTKSQQKVMGLLFRKPDASFYLNEIVRLADMGKGTIKRELEKMTKAGLLTVKRIGNQNHYQANPASPISKSTHTQSACCSGFLTIYPFNDLFFTKRSILN